jgi:hypothetical protein
LLDSRTQERITSVSGTEQLQVAAKASSGRQVKIQAVSRDADSTMVQKLATGALAAVVAAGALLPAPVMAADLALGKQVFEGEQHQICLAHMPSIGVQS